MWWLRKRVTDSDLEQTWIDSHHESNREAVFIWHNTKSCAFNYQIYVQILIVARSARAAIHAAQRAALSSWISKNLHINYTSKVYMRHACVYKITYWNVVEFKSDKQKLYQIYKVTNTFFVWWIINLCMSSCCMCIKTKPGSLTAIILDNPKFRLHS